MTHYWQCGAADCLLLLIGETHVRLAVYCECIASDPREEKVVQERDQSVTCCDCHDNVGGYWLLLLWCIHIVHPAHVTLDTLDTLGQAT